MIAIPGVVVLAQLYESANSVIYQGRREQDNQPVILKVLKEDYPTPAELSIYRQEYELTRNLTIEGVVRAYSLEKYQNTLVMLLEDIGGASLKILTNERTFTLKEFLKLSVRIAEIL